MATVYLTLDEVLAIHAHQVDRYGGPLGLRDRGLLESALAMPGATFQGEYLHPSLEEQAAAYVFHLVRNHPFLDGNKRTGLACGLVFLRLNGVRIRASDDELVEIIVGGASSHRSKADVAVFLRSRREGQNL